jgi:hypothetical protein
MDRPLGTADRLPAHRGDVVEEVALAASLATMAVAGVLPCSGSSPGGCWTGGAACRVGCPLAGDRPQWTAGNSGGRGG